MLMQLASYSDGMYTDRDGFLTTHSWLNSLTLSTCMWRRSWINDKNMIYLCIYLPTSSNKAKDFCIFLSDHSGFQYYLPNFYSTVQLKSHASDKFRTQCEKKIEFCSEKKKKEKKDSWHSCNKQFGPLSTFHFKSDETFFNFKSNILWQSKMPV